MMPLTVACFLAASATPTTARIAVDASVRGAPVSRNLFGKFTEHLGRNVYQGMWAQIVPNPEFARPECFGDAEGTERLRERVASEFNAPAPSSRGDNAPLWWTSGDVAVEATSEGGRDTQTVTVGARGGTLATGVTPPLHRCRSLELTLRARASTPATARVSLTSLEGEVVCHAQIVLPSAWDDTTADLTAPDAHADEPGTPYVLTFDLPAGTTVEFARALLFPSDNMDGWEPEVVEYMRDARLPMLRFPGGNFVSGYHWEDGVGPLDGRPVLANPAWHGAEWNHVGTDEWLRLCELTGAVPLICNNAGDGTPAEARAWIEYCNGGADTPMGEKRAENGRSEPWNVRYWEVGNEIYGGWQIGHTNAEGYAERYAEFIPAMLEADPDIEIIANGDDAAWNQALVERNGADVRSISVHSLPGGQIPADSDPEAVYLEFMAHAAGYDDHLRQLAAPMVAAGLTPNLAVTELQVFTNKRTLPNNASLTDALWTAGIIHACIRSGIVEMITHSAMLNHGGGLRKERGVVYTNPVWWTTHLYGAQAGVVPLHAGVECATFTNDGSWLGKREGVPYLDVMALAAVDDAELSLFVVNRHPTEGSETAITVRGVDPGARVETDMLTGDSPMAHNHLADREAVVPTHAAGTLPAGGLTHTFPARSLTRMRFVR
jgi:alpha-L-arabinofuranosidase